VTDLPPGWASTRLGDVVDVLDSQRVPVNAKERESRRGSVPYYGAAGQVGWIDRPIFQEELVLLGEDGVQFFQPEARKAYRISGPSWVNNHAHVLRPRGSLIDERLLCHALNHADYRSFANGTTRLKLTQAAMLQIPVTLPPRDEQRRIVEVLEAHLSRLEAGTQDLARADARLRSLLQSVVATATSRASGINRQSWPTVAIGDVAEVQGGIQKQPSRVPRQNRHPFLRVANVTRYGLRLHEVHEIEVFDGELERYKLMSGDLLVVEGNGSPSQVGRAVMWGGELNDCVHQNHLIRVRPSGGAVNPRFLEIAWNAPETRRRLSDLASSTSGLHTLSTRKIKALRLPMPTLADQNDAVESVDRWRTGIDVTAASLGMLSRRSEVLRRSLLRAAFSGRLVPQDPNDEPAELLLKRIQAVHTAEAPRTRRTREVG